MDTLSQTYQLFNRNKSGIFPANVAKSEKAIRLGLIGASKIAPISVINPVTSHPDIIITTVAARNKATAKAYAKKHNIPHVHNSYDDLVSDPSLDAVYIPLPNGLHYEWAQKALKAGKHVLLEKPSTVNSDEAAALFAPYLKSSCNAEASEHPILLEAVHSVFHPAFEKFTSLIDSENVATASASMLIPGGVIPDNDIRFSYTLGGGSVMDCGTYPIWALRKIFGTEPVECVEASPATHQVKGGEKVDANMKATFRFPNGGLGTMRSSLQQRGGYWFDWMTKSWPTWTAPVASATEREMAVPSLDRDKWEELVTKEVTMWNFVVPSIWHRIDVTYHHVLREKASGKIVKKWEKKEYVKEYGPPGREWWTTYRWQLEAFVNTIRGNKGKWVETEDSVGQVKAIDMIYEKAGLGIRPARAYLHEGQ